MVSPGRGPSTVNSAPFFTLIVGCVLSSCIVGAQCCMPMMNMMMPMMEQAQNAMVFQASNSMFKTLFEDLGKPLFQLHVGGATSLVYHVLLQMSPFPFAPENWFESAIQLGNFLVGAVYALIGVAEAISRTIISLAQKNWWSMLAGKVRMLYNFRLLFSTPVATAANPLALEADQQVALRVRDLNTEKDEGRSYEGAAQDCVRELLCGLYASRATAHLWQTFWTMVPWDEDRAEEPPNLPQLCEKQQEEFTSCYAFADDVVQTWQTLIEYSRYPYYNISSGDHRYHNETVTPWTWAMFG